MASMSPEEAYGAFVCQAICEDGSMTREEHDALIAHLASSGAIQSAPEELIHRVDGWYKTLGEDLLVEAAKRLPAALHAQVYAASAALARSDDDLDDDEVVFLRRARELLGISREQADALLDADA